MWMMHLHINLNAYDDDGDDWTVNVKFRYDLCHEKTCLWGFRPGLTQTKLYSHGDGYWLETSNLGR